MTRAVRPSSSAVPAVPALALAALATLAGLAGGARAHGGEDHGEPPPPPAAGDEVRTASAVTPHVELVLRWPARAASGGPLRFRALLSHFATNAPVEGGALSGALSASGQGDVALPLVATRSPGIYEGDVTLPADGSYALSLTLVAGELVDVIQVPVVEIAPPTRAEDDHDGDHAGDHDGDQAHADAHAGDHGGPGALAYAGVAALLALAAIAVVLVARRRKRRLASAGASVLVALVALGPLGAGGARAHGGEDHAEEASGPGAARAGPALPAGRVFLAKESQFLLGVRTVLAAERAVAERVSVPGVVAAPPERHAAVFVPQSGRVAPPRGGFPQLGAKIKRGQTLGVVEAVMTASDRASFLAEEARARSDVTAASARADAAKKNLQRLESLTGVSSKQEIEAARVAVATAEAEVEAARARIGAFTTSGGGGTARFELVSPLDGVLADINVSPGEVLTQGERAFLVIDPTMLTIEARVPEHELARLAGGRAAGGARDGGVESGGDAMVQVDAYPGRSFPAALIAEGQVIDEATRTAKVVFSVDNTAGLLKLGMFAQVQIGAGADEPALVVPDAAILDVEGRRVVYVHAAPEEFEERELQLGRRDGELVEVLRGLKAGERVVVVGGYNLRSAAR